MIEILLLLLVPLAAWAGWWFARATSRRSERKRNRLFSNQYFQGLNYLLNEQPDKAIEVFLEMAEVNEDTVETHLALGSLFRKRGEVDRAIRLHQNVISKQSLDDGQRLQALLELGEDYMRAGLFDRAERLFSELTERESQAPSALRHLLDIYQQEKDWEKALNVATRLEQATAEPLATLKSHFCCELAELELNREQVELARKWLRQARRHDPENVRGHLISARLARLQEHYSEAMGIYEEIARFDADHLPALIERYFHCAEKAGEMEHASAQLEQWMEATPSSTLILKHAELLEQGEGAEAAAKFLVRELKTQPNVRGLDRLMSLNQDLKSDPKSGEEILHAITRELLKRQSTWRCAHCGFSGHTHHWQCPSCKTWSTTRVIRGVLGE